MRKKLFKYIKLLISMVLILGLVAPSYASLSASDGSAFVTKAEFDSALADFNARLTTFEAGINSKIDSQVTSYLDRNGIWNGKKQTLLSCWGLYFATKMEESSKKFVLSNVGVQLFYPVQSNGTFSEVVWDKTDKTWHGVTLIDKVNKAGLMCLTYYYTDNTANHGWLSAAKNHGATDAQIVQICKGRVLQRRNISGDLWPFDDNSPIHWQTDSNFANFFSQTISFEQDYDNPLASDIYVYNAGTETTRSNPYTAAKPQWPVAHYFFIEKDKPLYAHLFYSAIDISLSALNNVDSDKAMYQCITDISAYVY